VGTTHVAMRLAQNRAIRFCPSRQVCGGAAMAIVRRELEPILANVVETGDWVFTAGAIADDMTLDAAGQMRQALGDLDKYLGLCGSDRNHILSAVIWLADIRLRDAINPVWSAWIDPRHLPTRACVENKMADPRCLVEIMIVAVKKDA
jgi:enamine deaminase RidA (YjgF/YER057c/UK114 family)